MSDQILRLQCTKSAFRWGTAPQTPLVELTSAIPSRMYLRGPLLRGGRGRKGKGEGKGEKMEGGIWPPKNFGVAPPME